MKCLHIAAITSLLIGCSPSLEKDTSERAVSQKTEFQSARPTPKEESPARPKDRLLPASLFLEAALEGKRDEIGGALRGGTEVDVTDEQGRTALMLAGFNGHTELVQDLLDAGADVNARDTLGRTALMYASTGPYAGTVKLLLESRAEVNAVDNQEKWTALMFAAAEGHRHVVGLLLDYGADPSLEDVDGETAATFAAQRGDHELARSLEKSDETNLN